MQKTSLLTATVLAIAFATGAVAAPLAESGASLKGEPVKSETLKFEPFNGAITSRHATPRLYTGRSAYRDTGHADYRNKHIGYIRGEAGPRFGHERGYADLVGDRDSGLGFYPLPKRYQEGAARYRYYNYAHRYYGPYGYGNPVQQAVVFDAIRNQAYSPTSAVNGYRYGVFDPIEGVGTPFFAGYYSAGTRDASDDPEPLLGNPLN
jgi:hypothetical protein